jgi:hypothetical protein
MQRIFLDKIIRMSYINVLKVGTDHTIWMRGLEFYKNEIDILQKRLLEVAGKNTAEPVMKGVEHFQNQFIIQQKNINDLRHAVKNYVKQLGNDSAYHAGHVDDNFLKEGNGLRERYEQLEQIMSGLRHEFNEFLSKWM